MGKPVLVVFARNPEPGEVKTRLAKDIGGEAAARVYRVLAENVWRKTHGGRYARWLFFTPPSAENALRKWLPGADRYLAQPTLGNLGQRLAAAFDAAFRSGAGKVVVVGTDLPTLTAELIEEAFDALDVSSAVLGPSEDGGFWLLGMRTPGRISFEGIEWGTSMAGRQMLHNLNSSGHDIARLAILVDVDTVEDLKTFPELGAVARLDAEDS